MAGISTPDFAPKFVAALPEQFCRVGEVDQWGAVSPPAMPASVGADSGSVQLTSAVGGTVTLNETSFIPDVATVHGYRLPQGAGALTNSGSAISVAASEDAVAFYVPASSPLSASNVFTNAASGIVSAEADANGASAYALLYETTAPKISNSGLIQSVSQGTAYGTESYGASSSFTNNASGILRVWGQDDAVGIYQFNGGTVRNDGLIEVTGGHHATGVAGASTFDNRGTIQAASIAGDVPSVAVDIYRNAASGGYTNSGTIIADYAFYVEHSSGYYPFEPDVTITNSGAITGDIVLADALNTVTNTGTIDGNIYFGNAAATYSGTSGHLHGDIFLGNAANNVYLGGDGNTVYGGGGSDSIYGGAGDDTFMIAHGQNYVEGGGGSNTLSLQSAAMGYTVDLGAHAAVGAGTTWINNIQQVIGSSFSDTLIAGNAGATLVAGGGADILRGGSGADTLVAGAGGDSLTGNGGDDSFIYEAGNGQVVITDFRANGDQDLLKIYGYGGAVSTQQQGADTLITLSGGDSVLLKNVSAAALSGGGLVYNAAAYVPAPTPQPLPMFGTQPIVLNSALTLYASEHMAVDFGSSSVAKAGIRLVSTASPVDNFGAVSFTASGGALYGVSDTLGITEHGPGVSFTNEAGASFSVVNNNGEATGLYYAFAKVVNAGAFTVSASGATREVDGYYGFYGDKVDFTNAAGATFTVHSDNSGAAGLSTYHGGTIRNDGAIDVSGTGTVYGIFDSGFEGVYGQTAPQIKNTGTIHVTSAAGTAIGVAIGGRDIPDLASRTAAILVNTGVISAAVAIKNLPPNRPDDGTASIALTNSGTILGDIDLSGMSSTITNVGGTITGNILLRDDYDSPTQRAAAGKRGGDTVDLRGGNFSGTITISAGAAGDVDDQYKIYTGTAITTVNFTGGQSHMTASVRADNGGHVTVAYDMASSGASWSRNADGSVTISAGDHGTETLMNVEFLSFTDRTIAINSNFGMPPSLTTAGVSALHARTLALSNLFTVSDRSAIIRYQLWDGTRDPASGYFVVNGVAQAAGAVIEITAAQLAQTSFVTGNVGDALQIRAFDGVNWSAADNANWSAFTVNVQANRAPALSTYNRLMVTGETQALSNLFSVSDYENDPMTRYQVWNASRDPDAGYFTINGVRQAAGALIEVTAAQLPQTRFVMGGATTSLQIRAFDGLDWSAPDNAAWAPFTVSVLPNHAPVLTTSDKSAAPGTVFALSSLFTVSDADGDSMVKYQLWDANRDPNSGHFVVNGQERPAGQVIELSYSELPQTSFVVGAVSDVLQIRAMDNRSGWSAGDNSAWSPFTVSAPPNSAPIVTTADVNAAANQTIALSALFSVSDSDGDTMTRYQLWDSTTNPASGHWRVNGVDRAAGTLAQITASQLAQTSFQTGTVGDTLQIRAFDGYAWSAADMASWAPFHVTV